MRVYTSHIISRDGHGRAASAYRSAGALMTLIADVARAADAIYPAAVSMRRWNGARAAGGHPDAPTAESVHQRLNRHASLKLSWQRIVEAALTQHSIQTYVVASWRTEKDKDLDARHVHYAFGLVIGELDDDGPFTPASYVRVCERLVARERRRLGTASPLEALLPSVAQVERIAGSWDDALALVGLAPYKQRAQTLFRRRDSMPVLEAAALFVTLNGRFPSYPVLSNWARDADISLSTPRSSGRWWAQVIDELPALLRERGVPVPTERPKAGRPRKGTDRSYVLPDQPVGAATPGQTYWHAERIVGVLREWERELPVNVEPSLARYRVDQSHHPDWPAPETVRDHGRWEVLRDEAVRRNTLVARGQPDEFEPLPARVDRGEQARRQGRALRVVHGPGHRKRADGARITVSDVIAAGLLTPGEQLTGSFKGTRYIAVVEPDGRLHVPGVGHGTSPSHAEKLATGQTKNGWRFWWAERDGQRRRLAAIRDELVPGT